MDIQKYAMKDIEINGLKMMVCSQTEWKERKEKGTILEAAIEWENGMVWVVGWPIMMSEIHQLIGLKDKGRAFDTDLPLDWTRQQLKSDPKFLHWHYVWLYDKGAFGFPYNVWREAIGKEMGAKVLDLALKAPEMEAFDA